MVREERLAYKELRRVDDNEGADDDEEEPGDATELRSLVRAVPKPPDPSLVALPLSGALRSAI